jgi:hypothetical protein
VYFLNILIQSAGRRDGLTRRPAEWLKIEYLNLNFFLLKIVFLIKYLFILEIILFC